MMGETSTPVMDLVVPNCERKYYSGNMVRQHHHFLIDGLRQFLVKGTLCDITLSRGSNNLHAHKVVMAASSPIFYTFLVNICKRQGESNQIVASDVDTEIMRLVLAYSYPGVLEADVNDPGLSCQLEHICKALEFLNMVEMLNHRCGLSVMDMDFNTVVRRWRVAVTHQLEGASKQIIHYLLSNFESFLKSPYFFQIPFELLAAIASCEDEHLVNEHLLLCALHKWVLYCPIMRISYIESLLMSMRAAMHLRGNFLTDVNELLVSNRCHCGDSSQLARRHSSPKLRSPRLSCHVISEDSVMISNATDEKRERASTGSSEGKTKAKKESIKFMDNIMQLPQHQKSKPPMCERLHEVVEKLWEGPQKTIVTGPLQISTSDTTTSKQNVRLEFKSHFPLFENMPANASPKKKSVTPEQCKTIDKSFMKGMQSSPEQPGSYTYLRHVDFKYYNTPDPNNDNFVEAVDGFINSEKNSVIRNNQEVTTTNAANQSSKQKLDELIQTIRAKLDIGTKPTCEFSRNESCLAAGPTLYRNDNLKPSDTICSLPTLQNRYTHSDQPSSFQAFKLERYCINKTEPQNLNKRYDRQEVSPRFLHEVVPKFIRGAEENAKLNTMTKSELLCSLASSNDSISPQSSLNKRSSQVSMWTKDNGANVVNKMHFKCNSPEDVPLSPRLSPHRKSKNQNLYENCKHTSSANLLPGILPKNPKIKQTSSPNTNADESIFGLSLPNALHSHITSEEIEMRLEKFKQVMNIHDSDLKTINLKGSQSFVIPCIGDSDETISPDWEMESYMPSSFSDDELYFSPPRGDWTNFENGYYRVLSTIPEECQEDIASSSSVRTDRSSCQQTSPNSSDLHYPRRKPWGIPSDLTAIEHSEAQQSPRNSSRNNSLVVTGDDISQHNSDPYPSWVIKMCEANKSSVTALPPENNLVTNLSTVHRPHEITMNTKCAHEGNATVCELPVKSTSPLQHLDLEGSKTGSNTTININKKSPRIQLNLHGMIKTASPISNYSVPASVSSASYDDILSTPRSPQSQRKTGSAAECLTPLSQWLEKLQGGHESPEAIVNDSQSPRSSFSSYSLQAVKNQQSPRCLLTPESVRVLMLPETPSSSVFSVSSEQAVVYQAGSYTSVKTEFAYEAVSDTYRINHPSKNHESREVDDPETYFSKYAEEHVVQQDTSPKLNTKYEKKGPYFSKNKQPKTDYSRQIKHFSKEEQQSTNRSSPMHMSKKPIPYYKKAKPFNKIPKSGVVVAASEARNGQMQLDESDNCTKSDTSIFVSLKELDVVCQELDKPTFKISPHDEKERNKPRKEGEKYYDSDDAFKNSSESAFLVVKTNEQSQDLVSSQSNITNSEIWGCKNYNKHPSIRSEYGYDNRNDSEFGLSSCRTHSYFSDLREYSKSSKKKSGFSHTLAGKHSRFPENRKRTDQSICDCTINWKDDELQEISVRRTAAEFLPLSMLNPLRETEKQTNASKVKQVYSQFTDTLMESVTSTEGVKPANIFVNSKKELNFLPIDIGPVLVFLSENDNGTANRYCYSLKQKAWIPPLTLMVPKGANNCSIAYYDNKIYFIGGDADCVYQRHNSMRAYNCLKNCLETLTDMGIARVDSGVTVFDEHIYVIGGLGKYHKALAQVERYNIARDSWKLIAAMRHARSCLSIATVAGLIYAIGGVVNSNKSLSMVTRACERYDPTIDQWSELDNLPSHFGSVIPLAVAIGDRLYAVRIKAPEKVYTFNMSRGKWMAVKDSRLATSSISVLLPGKWRMYAVSASAKIIFVFDFHAYQWQIENHFPEEVKWMQLAYAMNLSD